MQKEIKQHIVCNTLIYNQYLYLTKIVRFCTKHVNLTCNSA